MAADGTEEFGVQGAPRLRAATLLREDSGLLSGRISLEEQSMMEHYRAVRGVQTTLVCSPAGPQPPPPPRQGPAADLEPHSSA